MVKNNLKNLVDLIDDYANEQKKQFQSYKLNHSYISNYVNSNYLYEQLYDKNFVGVSNASNLYYYPPHTTNEYPVHFLTNENQTHYNSEYYNSTDNLLNYPYYPYYYSNYYNTSDQFFDPYSIWQQQHDITNILQQSVDISNNKLTEIKEKITIDASMNTLSDILSIIETYEYKPNIDYNIDLCALHNIKTELVELNNMIGMQTLKQSVLEQLMYFIQELHLGENVSDFKHTVVYGPPGTGKTEIAKIIGRMYSKLGILKNNIFKKVTRSDLISGYLGQTAIKTKNIISETLGGVLFIDEAYSLASREDNDIYSKECIDTLCEALSHHKNDLMVIIAGYENELNETIFRVNKGMESRFIWRFKIDNYSPNELMYIFKKKVIEQEWSFEKEENIKERWFMEKKSNFNNFGRDMELLFLYIKMAHGKRIYGKPKECRKRISIEDMDNGYKTFVSNKRKDIVPEYLNTIYM